MTVDECASRDRQTIDRIRTAMKVDSLLANHAGQLDVMKSEDAVIVTGKVPSERVFAAIIPMIRRAGVVDRVEIRVGVA